MTRCQDRRAAVSLTRLAPLVALAVGVCASAPMLLAQDPIVPHGRALLTDAGALFGLALLADAPLWRFAAAHRSRGLDRAGNLVDPFGRAEYLVPSLVAGAVLPRLVRDRPLADAVLRIGLGYAASDLAGGVVRVVVARHRPDSTGDAWRFRPFRPQGDWGSMPSAHVTHAFAIAAGVAEESGRPWLARVAYGIASLVAVQRIYRQAHWSSDVVAAAAMSIQVSRLFVDGHRVRREPCSIRQRTSREADSCCGRGC